MKNSFILFLFLYFPVYGQLHFSDLPFFPGTARDDAVAVVHNHTLYCGFGLVQGFFYENDWWQFDLTTQEWTSLPDAPLSPQQYLRFFVIGDNLYLYGGTNGSRPENATHEFWRFSFNTQKWKPLQVPPFEPRWAGVGFSQDNYGYLGLGFNGDQNFKDFWQYQPQKDSWLRLPDFGGKPRGKCLGVASLKEGLVAGGLNEESNTLDFLKDIWHFNFKTKTWEQSAAELKQEGAYFYSTALANGFLLGGGYYADSSTGPEFLKKMQYYSGLNQKIEVIGTLPQNFGRGGSLVQADGGDFYLLWGLDSDLQRVDAFMQLKWMQDLSQEISFFPNPVRGGHAYLESKPVRQWALVSSQGQVIHKGHFKPPNSFQVFHWQNLAHGVYYLRLSFWNQSRPKTIRVLKL